MKRWGMAAICLLLMLCSCAFAEDLPQAVQSLICEGGLLGGMPGDALRINCADGEQYCFVLSKDSYWLLGYVCRGENQEAWTNDMSVTPLADHYGSLHFDAHNSAILRPDGKPWENAEGFDVVSTACGCRISYRYDGESFRPQAWVSPCHFEGQILWEDEHLLYFRDDSHEAADRLHLRVQPQKGATSLGKFYNGTPVEVLEERGDWCRVRIGLDARFEGYMMKRFLAFGEAMDEVDCVFPQLTLREEYGELKAYMLPENAETAQLFGEVWIAGVVGDEWYVLLTDEGFTGCVPQDWFWEGNG